MSWQSPPASGSGPQGCLPAGGKQKKQREERKAAKQAEAAEERAAKDERLPALVNEEQFTEVPPTVCCRYRY